MGEDNCDPERIYRRINDNSHRITRLETLVTADSEDNKQTHQRIEHKIDQLADLVGGFRYMIRGAQWVAGVILGIMIWIIHEWEILKKLFRGT